MTRECPQVLQEPHPAPRRMWSLKDVGFDSRLGSTLAKREVWADHLKTPQNGVKCNNVLSKLRRIEGFACKMGCNMQRKELPFLCPAPFLSGSFCLTLPGMGKVELEQLEGRLWKSSQHHTGLHLHLRSVLLELCNLESL